MSWKIPMRCGYTTGFFFSFRLRVFSSYTYTLYCYIVVRLNAMPLHKYQVCFWCARARRWQQWQRRRFLHETLFKYSSLKIWNSPPPPPPCLRAQLIHTYLFAWWIVVQCTTTESATNVALVLFAVFIHHFPVSDPEWVSEIKVVSEFFFQRYKYVGKSRQIYRVNFRQVIWERRAWGYNTYYLHPER